MVLSGPLALHSGIISSGFRELYEMLRIQYRSAAWTASNLPIVLSLYHNFLIFLENSLERKQSSAPFVAQFDHTEWKWRNEKSVYQFGSKFLLYFV